MTDILAQIAGIPHRVGGVMAVDALLAGLFAPPGGVVTLAAIPRFSK
jgi:hypothetical protein